MPHANTNNHRPAIAFTSIRIAFALVAILGMSALQRGETYDESIGTNRDMLVNPDGTRKLIRRAEGGPVDLRPKKLVHSGIGAMAGSCDGEEKKQGYVGLGCKNGQTLQARNDYRGRVHDQQGSVADH